MDDDGLGRGKAEKTDLPGCAAPVGFVDVLAEELEDLTRSEDEIPPEQAEEHALKSGLAGLALSGGGIRSATFNLGVIQALAKARLLEKFHYLSTVSGGGYIGSWLTAWIKRKDEALGDLPEDQARKETLFDDLAEDLNRRPEHGILGHLREYSNYLTPRASAASLDTWAFVNSYVRNTLLNLLVIGLAVVAWASSLHAFLLALEWLRTSILGYQLLVAGLGLILLAMLVAFISLGHGQGKRGQEEAPPPPGYGAMQVQISIVLPLVVSACFLSAWLIQPERELRWDEWGKWLLAGPLFAIPWILAPIVVALGETRTDRAEKGPASASPESRWSVYTRTAAAVDRAARATSGFNAMYQKDPDEEPGKKRLRWSAKSAQFRVALAALVVGCLAGLALLALGRFLQQQLGVFPLAFGPIMILTLFQLTGKLMVGMAGSGFSSGAREWWGRLGGALWLWILLSGFFFATLQFARPVLSLFQDRFLYSGEALALIWAAVSSAGAYLASRSGDSRNSSGIAVRLVVNAAPAVLVIGLLVAGTLLTAAVLPGPVTWISGILFDETAVSLSYGIEQVGAFSGPVFEKLFPLRSSAEWYPYWSSPDLPLRSGIFLMPVLFGGAAFLLSWFMGLNRFSMHELYRNRLVRCYPGASNTGERHPFTGFSNADDGIVMGNLDKSRRTVKDWDRLYPIINTTLNLTAGRDLAWQQRKAASFVFTPKYCGFEGPRTGEERELGKGYRPTEKFAGNPSLGTAMAISGAAASPNMGYHSSSSLAFLMTILNVRLGWWIANPARQERWTVPGGPRAGLFYLLTELLGMTNSRRKFVYLSDGGHFENLGLYELVRRRCRFIVVCDAEADPGLQFHGLGSAIEKCRTDFGVEIELNIDELQRQDSNGLSHRHCAVGRIRYPSPRTDGQARDRRGEEEVLGTIVYIKATLTGDEPTDLRKFAAQNPSFPHQPTSDQWFSEAQFESYRALGQHIGERVFKMVRRQPGEEHGLSMEFLFASLRQYWYPRSALTAASFSRHTARYVEIIERIRTTPELDYLEAQLFPEWSTLTEDCRDAPKANYWLPSEYEKLRHGFYISNQIIQLMEDVYLDLDLERTFDHPDNRGWMNYFQRWAGSGIFRASWAVSSASYGARFREFCERALSISGGRIQPVPVVELDPATEGLGEALARAPGKEILNFREKSILNVLLQNAREAGEKGAYRIVGLHSLVWSPVQDLMERPLEGKHDLSLPFGFAVVDPSGRLHYLRVQDHLRRLGLARRALRKLMAEERIDRESFSTTPSVPDSDDRPEIMERLFISVRDEFAEDHGVKQG